MLILALAATLAAAPAAPAPDAARLFEEGRAALKANDFLKACAAFSKSHQLQPALGVLLNLASCLEKQGKLGSAWMHFNEAITWAVRTHEGDREQFAREHAASLKPRVAWLALSAASDCEIVVDEAPPLALSPRSPTSIPIDPGAHQIVARANGFEPWTTSVSVYKEGTTVLVAVPALKAIAVAAAPVVAAPARTPDPGPPPPPPPLVIVQTAAPNTAGMSLLVGGGALAIVGGIGLGWSLSTYGNLQGQQASLPNPDIRVSRETFEQLKWIYPTSWVLVGVGAAAVLTGIVWTVRNSSGPKITPVMGPRGAGVAVWGTF